MRKLPFGKTSLPVSPLGFGAAPIGYLDTDRQRVARILNLLLDAGVNLIDTAANYPGSEEAIADTVGAPPGRVRPRLQVRHDAGRRAGPAVVRGQRHPNRRPLASQAPHRPPRRHAAALVRPADAAAKARRWARW